MIAFDIFLDEHPICRVAMAEQHVLTISLHGSRAKKNKPVFLNVMGSAMAALGIPQQVQEMTPSKEKFLEIMAAITNKGMYKWVQKDLEQKFKIDIHVIEAEPESISPTEITQLDMSGLDNVIETFGDTFPSSQD